jgi:hypothetical protein
MHSRSPLPLQLTEEQIATFCVYCRRVRTSNETWLEQERCLLELMHKHLSHGACPSCYHDALALLEEEIGLDQKQTVACR